MKKVVHFIYPKDSNKISAPYSIGNELSKRLCKDYVVCHYDWDSNETIIPGVGDVLLGHPNPIPGTIFRNSLVHPGWSRKLALSPYNGDTRQVAFMDKLIDYCDLYLAITGKYWFDGVHASPMARWEAKMRHIDMAVNLDNYRRIKFRFNPPGQRRFLYIGSTINVKNTKYLARLATHCLKDKIGWVGVGNQKKISGIPNLGYVDFSTPQGEDIVRQFDFLITVGTWDANPTTILESMAWGLIPVCSKTSGYDNEEGILNISIDDEFKAALLINELQQCDADCLEKIRTDGMRVLARRYTWDRFYGQIVDAIESIESPALRDATIYEILILRNAEFASPRGPVYRGLMKAKNALNLFQ